MISGFLTAVFAAALLAAAPAYGKDVYVAAGADGDGTRASPYGSIAEALDMGVYAGDVVHVAEGVYYGKGGSGKWVIRVNDLTLVGGYSQDFAERDPWRHPTVLVRGMGPGAIAEARSRGHESVWGLDLALTKASYNPGAMIVGEGDYDGAVVDGFVIDGYTRNTYKPNGDLRTDVGPIGAPLVDLTKPGCKVRNCVVMNSGGPGIRLLAGGERDRPETWSEVSNTVVVNTLMQAIDFRMGTWDPDKRPTGGYAVVADNTLAFVWSWLGEGYGILVGRQTSLTVERNVVAFVADYGVNNGLGNDRARLVDNCFFAAGGGVYRFFDPGNKVTVVEDDAAKLEGTAARRRYFLDAASSGNVVRDPELRPDPAFLERKGFAPVYEHAYLGLWSGAVAAGAKPDRSRLATYRSAAAAASSTEYLRIGYGELKDYLGRDVTVSVAVGNEESSGWYVDGVSRETHVCFRTKDMQHFLYVRKGTEALETIRDCRRSGVPALVSGALVDIRERIKMSNKYAIVVEAASRDG